MDKKWLSQWYDWLRAERGYGDNTLSAYARDIEIFCEFLAGENLAAPALSRQDFRAFLAAEQSRGLARTTLARRVSSIRCLLYTSPSPRDRTRSRMPSSA